MWILYDTIDLLNAIREDGTYFPGTFNFSASASVTNEERINDQNIYQAISSFGAQDAIRFDLGSAKAADTVAVYFSAAETNDLILYASANSDSSDDNNVEDMTANFSKGWAVGTFTEATKRYWFLRSSSGTVVNLTELLIGKRTTFDFQPDMGISYAAKHGITDNTTPGGRFRSKRRFAPKKVFTLNWTSIDSTFKTTLETMKNTTHGDMHPVLFYDDSNYWYCRMTGLNMTEVAFNRYSTSLTLEEI